MDRLPSRTIFVAHILREEYPRFRAGLPADHRLPFSYEDWYSATVHAHQVHRAAGLDTQAVVVRWDDLTAYAARIRMTPSYALLMTYAISRGHVQKRGATQRDA